MFGKIRRIHLVGIGGTGMSGIAELLLNLGYRVTGSDIVSTEVTRRLSNLGADVRIGHDPQNLQDAEVVIYSSAVRPDNVELVEAKRKGIPVIPRAEMLAELMRMKYGIAVGGAHGKTTTTWLVGLVLAAAGLDPTIIVGGRLKALGTNAKLGSGRYIVAEADESDGSFLKLSPAIAVVTTIDEEHLNHYGDIEALKSSFIEFVNKVPFYGAAVVCLDEENVQTILPMVTRRVVTYGFSQQAEVRAANVVQEGTDVTFDVIAGGSSLGSVLLHMPGDHNVLNALAAIAVGLEIEVPFEKITEGIASFTGISRRLEVKGEVNGVIFVDDYAHHPTEIVATLEAVRSTWNRPTTVIFQPHRYTRTQALWEKLGRSFYDADKVIVTSIYAAGEDPIQGVCGELVAEAAIESGHRDVVYLPDHRAIVEHVLSNVKPGDLILTLGAGDIWKVGEEIARRLSGGKDS